MDCGLPGSSVHGIFQARVLEWVAISFSGDLLHPGIKPGSPALQVGSSQMSHQGSSLHLLEPTACPGAGPGVCPVQILSAELVFYAEVRIG